MFEAVLEISYLFKGRFRIFLFVEAVLEMSDLFEAVLSIFDVFEAVLRIVYFLGAIFFFRYMVSSHLFRCQEPERTAR